LVSLFWPAYERKYKGVDKIMETIRNSGTEFVLATLKELQMATLNVLRLFTLCSACAKAFVIPLSDSPCEKSENGRLVRF
jgi:hypothetical protein